jgi:hypothetical protein
MEGSSAGFEGTMISPGSYGKQHGASVPVKRNSPRTLSFLSESAAEVNLFFGATIACLASVYTTIGRSGG